MIFQVTNFFKLQQKRSMAVGRVSAGDAFTLIELLVVIAIIAILAAILLPVLTAAQKKAQQTFCMNDLKQLALGMTIYTDTYSDTYPACASTVQYGFTPVDWIYWQTVMWNNQNYLLSKSLIIQGIGGTLGSSMTNASSLLRCPMDTYDTERDTAGAANGTGPYLFSYSIPNFGIGQGLTSIDDIKNGTGWHPFKSTMVRNPTLKIMIVEEQTSAENSMKGVGQCSQSTSDNSGATVVDDGRWVGYPANYIVSRHDQKGNVAFVDGHVETVPWQFGTNQANTLPLY